jgi:hypothetical protein
MGELHVSAHPREGGDPVLLGLALGSLGSRIRRNEGGEGGRLLLPVAARHHGA